MNPRDIPNLSYWFAADSLALNDGDPVDSIPDLSATGLTFTASGTTRPTFKVKKIGGRPAIYFDGSDDQLSHSTGFNYSGKTGLTVFAVYSIKAALPGNGGIINEDNYTSTRGWNLFNYADTDVGFIIPINSSTRVIRRSLTSVGAYGRPTLTTARFQASTEQTVWLNGTSDNDTIDGSVPATVGASGVDGYIGRTGAGEYWKGFIAELIVYDTNLSDTNRQWIEQYLRDKYQIPSTITDTFQSPNISAQQGYAWDGSKHYTIETTALRKRADDASWTIEASNTSPFASLSGTPNHIGDGCVHNGKLYVPVENYVSCGSFSDQQIAVYNTSDLSYSTHASISAQGHEAAALAIDSQANEIYICSYCNGASIWVYRLSDLGYLRSISLDYTIVNPQGLAYKNGFLFLADTDGDVWRIHRDSGSVEWMFKQASAYTEYEGLDYTSDTLRWLIHETGSTYKVHYFTGFPYGVGSKQFRVTAAINAQQT